MSGMLVALPGWLVGSDRDCSRSNGQTGMNQNYFLFADNPGVISCCPESRGWVRLPQQLALDKHKHYWVQRDLVRTPFRRAGAASV